MDDSESVVVKRVKTFGKDGFKMGRLLKFLNWEAWQRHFNQTKETILGTFSRGGEEKKKSGGNFMKELIMW